MHNSNINQTGPIAGLNRKMAAAASIALAAIVAATCLDPTLAQAQKVTAGGMGIFHSDSGESPVAFSLNRIVCEIPNSNPDSPGTIAAKGTVYFVIHGAFATVNGADVIHLQGRVLSADVSEDPETIVLYGTLREVDHAHGEGIVFETQDNFYIVIGCDLAENTFVLQWCDLPEFLIEVTNGILKDE